MKRLADRWVSPMNHERGFTLLEVLIAFAIAALSLGALARGIAGGLWSAQAAGHYQEAVTRALSHLATLDRGVPLVPGEQEGDDSGGFRWRIRISQLAATVAPRNPAGPSPAGARDVALYAVSVGVSWCMDGRVREVVLDSRRVGAAPREAP